jgi:hypothetical protein
MNSVIVTGYLNADAEERFTPKAERKYHFDVVVDVGGGHVPWQCVMDDAALIERHWTFLTSGRPCILECKLSGLPVVEHGRVKYWSRFLRVVAAEFPNRGGAKKDEAKADEKTSTPAEAAKV